MSTENNPGDLQETSDQPTLTTPGSRAKYFASCAEEDMRKHKIRLEDFSFSVIGITYHENRLVPCFLKEEQYDDESIKAYHGDLMGFMEHLASYHDLVNSGNDRKVVGAYHLVTKINSEDDKLFLKWDPERMGPRVIPGFI
jgi:hypothetical protein